MNTRGLPCSPVSNISEWPSLDARALRAALERLTTSTALITASGPDGDLIGATASSFNSISDNPPLVLWSLSRAADAVAVFSNAAHWAVHVLSPGQSDLHARLTRAEHGRFDGVAFERGIEGVPLLDGCLARFVCRGVHAYETPDHLVLIGEVVQLQHNDMPARARHDSQAANGDDGGPAAARREADAGATADSLGFLLGSAFFYMYGQLREAGGKMGFTNIELFVIMALGERPWRSRHDINALLFYGGHSTNLQVLDDLEASGLLVSRTGASERPDDMEFDLTPNGHIVFGQFARVSTAIQQDMERLLGAPATATLRTLLRGFVKDTESSRRVKW